MKVKAGFVSRFIASPEQNVTAVLLYGPDRGLVREHATALTKTIVEDERDPFRVSELTPAAIKDDPALLADEAAAIALTGGRRVVRVREAGDWAATAAANYLEARRDGGDALVIVEAGDLGPRSKLRKLFEDAANAVALPCYPDEGAALDTFIRTALSQAGLEIDADALNYIARCLGPDRVLGRRELEKLALHCQGSGRVSLEDAKSCIGDSGVVTLEDLSFATAEGDIREAFRALDRAVLEGVAAIAVIRSLGRHFQRLDLASGIVAGGAAQETAMRALRPPVFFKKEEAFRRQLRVWRPPDVARALNVITEAERSCKSTGIPAAAVCGDVVLALARMATRQHPSRAGRGR